MKKWQLGWKLMTTVQKTVFIMLVVCAISAVVLPETPYLVRVAGLGAIGAWLVVRPRRRRSSRDSPATAGHEYELPRQPTPKVLTEAERAIGVRTAAWHNGRRMFEGNTNRVGALEGMREAIPGFPSKRYKTELDEALGRIEGCRASICDHCAQLVTEARKLDALNAVFAIHYYNRRYSRHIGQYGLGEIDLARALGDLFSPKQVEEKVVQSDALIEECFRMRSSSRGHELNMTLLRQTQPGFNDKALGDALDWGRVINR